MSTEIVSSTTSASSLSPNPIFHWVSSDKKSPFLSARLSIFLKKWRQKPWVIRLMHKEFWQTPVLYLPAFLSYPAWALRAGSPIFFTAANPSIETGGMMGENKAHLSEQIPPQYRPQNAVLYANENAEMWQTTLKNAGLSFPLIAKPVVGGRGIMVDKILNFNDLEQHIKRFSVDFLVEAFIEYPVEAAVLFWKNPITGAHGILSVTLKKFLTVRGNNVSTVRALLGENFRGILQLKRLEREKPDLLATVPACGKEILIEPIGNHCRGTGFINANDLINDQMIAAFHRIHAQLSGCYLYRLDIKTPSVSDLQNGQNLIIMELNGVGAEPAHIYDPNIPFWQIWRDTYRLWQKIFEISRANHRLGVAYQSWRDFRQCVRRQSEFVMASKK